MPVDHYGVFAINSLSYLFQTADNRGWDCLGQGMEAPVRMELPAETTRLPIPHQFDLSSHPSNDQLPEEFLNNPVVDLYLPKPVLIGPPKIAYIKSRSMEAYPYLKKLSDLSCLMPTSTRVFEKDGVERYAKELQLTNIGPLTIVGVPIVDSAPIYRLTELAMIFKRHLVITGHPDIPMPKDARDYTASFNVMCQMLDKVKHLDFRRLGSMYLRSWARYQYTLHGQKGSG
jgi:hypothetical protein